MFGDRFFGKAFFGNHYFGPDASGTVVTPTETALPSRFFGLGPMGKTRVHPHPAFHLVK